MSAQDFVATMRKLIAREVRGKLPRWRWGAVTSITPITVELDAQQGTLPEIGSLVAGLTVGDRVEVRTWGTRSLITGVAGGAGHDTAWTNFSWTDPEYINNPAQSSYTRNQWQVKSNFLVVPIGFGVAADLNTANEIEIARVPIKAAFPMDSFRRYWATGVGGSGVIYGFIAYQTATHISFYIKSHTSSIGSVGRWASTTFTIPLNDGWQFV